MDVDIWIQMRFSYFQHHVIQVICFNIQTIYLDTVKCGNATFLPKHRGGPLPSCMICRAKGTLRHGGPKHENPDKLYSTDGVEINKYGNCQNGFFWLSPALFWALR